MEACDLSVLFGVGSISILSFIQLLQILFDCECPGCCPGVSAKLIYRTHLDFHVDFAEINHSVHIVNRFGERPEALQL